MGRDKHVLFVTFFLQAHFRGMYRYAVSLAKRGVKITFVALAREIALLRNFEELRTLDFNLVSYHDHGENNFETPSEVPVVDVLEFLATGRLRFQPVLDKLVARQKAGLAGPTCVFGDRTLIWAKDAAKELGIPFVQFWTCGAGYMRALQAQVSLYADGTLKIRRGAGGCPYLEPFEGHVHVAGLPPLEHRDIRKPFQLDFKNACVRNDIEIGTIVNMADAVIVNSFYEFEAPQIDAIRQTWLDRCTTESKIPKMFLVGPLSAHVSTVVEDRSLVDRSSGVDALQWLDRRPPLSVVYICMGTVVRLTRSKVEELAAALEASEQSFLWIVSRGVKDLIPLGFEARTRENGLVVNGWVPQLRILQHSAIGGLVTHCGWNSVLESIMSGVPMAAWPQMLTDQYYYCRHIVDVLKVAVEVLQPETLSSAAEKAAVTSLTFPKRYVTLEQAVRILLSEEGNALRARAQKLKKRAEAAVADGGASSNAMNDVFEFIPS
ncbi:hypothetical protein M758_3G097800 [Ceratodon purpureus]|nr:hypothetical protein M758_3G097800 [Ceratodon purpureus]